MNELLDADTLRQILIVAGIIVGTFLVGRLAVWLFIDVLFMRLTRRTKTSLDDKIVEVARRPLFFFFVLMGFNIAIGQLTTISDSLRMAIQDTLLVIVIIIGAYLAYRLLLDILTWYAEGVAQRTESRFDEQFVGFTRRVLQIVMVILVGIMILSSLDVDITGLVAGLGVGSLAIALAAQALLEDTFAGFAVMVDRPFVVGDRILLPKAIGGVYGSWGDVIEIKLRSTIVRSTDGVVLTVPNSLLTKDVMINFSHMESPPLRVRIRVGLERQWANIEAGIRIIEDILNTHTEVSHEPRPPQVIVRELRDWDVLLEARYYVLTPGDMRKVNSDVLAQIIQRFEHEGVQMSDSNEMVLREDAARLP